MSPLVTLLLRLAIAVLVFFLVTSWPVPLILAHLALDVPQMILWIVGFVLAVLAFIRGPIWAGGRL